MVGCSSTENMVIRVFVNGKTRHWFGYQDFFLVLKTFKVLQFLVFCGTRSHILGAKYFNDWRP